MKDIDDFTKVKENLYNESINALYKPWRTTSLVINHKLLGGYPDQTGDSD